MAEFCLKCLNKINKRTQLNNYCNNDIARLDIDALARICSAFNCQISDLLEYVLSKTNDAEINGIENRV